MWGWLYSSHLEKKKTCCLHASMTHQLFFFSVVLNSFIFFILYPRACVSAITKFALKKPVTTCKHAEPAFYYQLLLYIVIALHLLIKLLCDVFSGLLHYRITHLLYDSVHEHILVLRHRGILIITL